MFAQVVIDMKNDHINDYYDYSIPSNLEEFVKVGTRVLVSFGFRDLLGYVIGITEESKFDNNIKPLKAVLDYEQELTLEQVELAKYMSEEYCVSLVSVLELMIPSFLKGQKRSYLVVKDYDKLHPVLHMLFEGKILFQGTPEELAENQIVREKYLSNSFVLRRKEFQIEEK